MQSSHLGRHEAILELSRLRYEEAIGNRPAADAETALVMIGRGSHDAEATAEMQRFVTQCTQSASVRRAIGGFVAMAEPDLPQALDEAASLGAARVVVQPHLLFGGVLVDRIRHTVEQYRAHYPAIEWIATSHLGPCELLAQAVLGRAAEALLASGAC
jgi:sirohydrochlorin cobaltochelatase